MRAVWFVLLVGCYENPALDDACKVRCTDSCPTGSSCVAGYCVTPGQTCGADGDGGIAAPCAVEVSLGRRHACMRKPNGTVWCSGHNTQGQLGNAAVGADVSTPVQAFDDTGPITDAIGLGLGRDASCAIRTGGEVWCWGDGNTGQLGNLTYEDAVTAQRVVVAGGAPLTNVVQVEGGDDFFCARDSANAIWCWGYGAGGRLGDSTGLNREYAVPALDNAYVAITDAAELSVGPYHSCVRTTGNHVECWGRGGEGQLGNGMYGDGYIATAPVTSAASVSVGSFHTCTLNADATITCWGELYRERLGITPPEGVTSIPMPTTPVLTAAGGTAFTASAIAVAAVSCALVDGAVMCWGHSIHGQAGAGSPYPQPILTTEGTPLVNVTRITAKYAHACAYRDDGYILCWGRNSEGEYGIGNFANTGLATPLGLTCP